MGNGNPHKFDPPFKKARIQGYIIFFSVLNSVKKSWIWFLSLHLHHLDCYVRLVLWPHQILSFLLRRLISQAVVLVWRDNQISTTTDQLFRVLDRTIKDMHDSHKKAIERIPQPNADPATKLMLVWALFSLLVTLFILSFGKVVLLSC